MQINLNFQKYMPSIVLYQPDIPQNVGAFIRLCAGLDLGLHIIEPCGFPWDERKIRQSAMDYAGLIDIVRHSSWKNFYAQANGGRLILMTTKAEKSYIDFEFKEGDFLIAGQESVGAPDFVHKAAHMRLKIPMHGDARSLNIVNASAMMVSEALRQTRWSSKI